jgi:hypothetical protein
MGCYGHYIQEHWQENFANLKPRGELLALRAKVTVTFPG